MIYIGQLKLFQKRKISFSSLFRCKTRHARNHRRLLQLQNVIWWQLLNISNIVNHKMAVFWRIEDEVAPWRLYFCVCVRVCCLQEPILCLPRYLRIPFVDLISFMFRLVFSRRLPLIVYCDYYLRGMGRGLLYWINRFTEEGYTRKGRNGLRLS